MLRFDDHPGFHREVLVGAAGAAANAAGAVAPTAAAGVADAEAAAVAVVFFFAVAAVWAKASCWPKPPWTSKGATTNMGTTTAAQSALCQRIIDPFFPLFPALAKEIPALSACVPLTPSSLFGRQPGVQRLDA